MQPPDRVDGRPIGAGDQRKGGRTIMTTKRLVMLASGAVWMALGGSPAQAVQSKCLAGKSKCVSTLTSGLRKCHQTSETPGKTPDPNAKGCLDKAVTKFD